MLFLDKVISWVFPLSLIAVPFLLVNWLRYINSINDRKSRGEVVFQFEGFPYKSVFAFLCPILLISLSSSIITSTIKSQVVEFLSHEEADAVVSVEGSVVDDSKFMIRELQKISTSLGHHSHPEKTIHVKIVSNGRTLRLSLGRDTALTNIGFSIHSTNIPQGTNLGELRLPSLIHTNRVPPKGMFSP